MFTCESERLQGAAYRRFVGVDDDDFSTLVMMMMILYSTRRLHCLPGPEGGGVLANTATALYRNGIGRRVCVSSLP